MIATSCCIVEFKDENSQAKFMSNYGKLNYGIIDQIKLWWEMSVLKRETKQIHFKGRLLRIEQAPEP